MRQSIEKNCPHHGPYYAPYDDPEAECPICAERKYRNYEKFIAKIPKAYLDVCFENYITVTEEQRGTVRFCRAFVQKMIELYEQKKPLKLGLVFFGKPGTGKTHLVLSILKQLAKAGISVEYITCTQLAEYDVSISVNRNVENERAHLKKVQVLVIDDLVKQTFPSRKELLFNIVDTRYSNLECTILITNAYDKGFNQHDPRVISRMQERAYFLPFMWEDYRATVKKLGTKKQL